MAENKAKAIEPGTPEYYEELVPITPPIDDTAKQSKYLVLSLNGRKLRVPRGETTMIPRKYLLSYNKRIQVLNHDRDYQEKLRNSTKEIKNS